MKKNFFTTIIILLTLCFSCEHKELCYNHPHVIKKHVIFDWTNAKEAAPNTMMFYLHSNELGSYTNYDYPGRDGGEFRALAGNYSALCYNSDSKKHTFSNTNSHSLFTISTKTTVLLSELGAMGIVPNTIPRANSTEKERIALSPDMIWCNNLENFELSDKEETITLYPDTIVFIYTLTIYNAKNLNNVKGLSCSISGMTGGYLIGQKQKNEESVTIPFSAAINRNENIVTATFHTFGENVLKEKKHIITVYAILMNDTKWYYTYDVTNQVHTAPNERHVDIVLNELPLPEKEIEDGEIQTNVEEWNLVEIEMNM